MFATLLDSPLPVVPGVTLRTGTEDDCAAIAALLNADFVARDQPYRETAESIRTEWAEPGAELRRDSLLAFDEAGALVGYSYLFHRPTEEDAEIVTRWVIHPDWAGDREALARAAMTFVVARLRADGAAEPARRTIIATFFNEETEAARAPLLARMGFESVRWFFNMRYADLAALDSAPSWPEGIVPEVIAYDDVAGYDRFRAAHNEAFRDHWNFHPWPDEAFIHWRDAQHDRAHRHLILATDRATGEVAGYCIAAIHPDDWEATEAHEGWIHLLGVRRPWRSRGLGRALLIAGMHHLKAVGAETAMLGVDGANPTGATHLYERVGYRAVRRHRAFHGDLHTVAAALATDHAPITTQ